MPLAYAFLELGWTGPMRLHHASKYLLTNSRGQRGPVRATKLIYHHLSKGASKCQCRNGLPANHFGRTAKMKSADLSKVADHYQCRSRRWQTIFLNPPKLALSFYFRGQTISTPFRSCIILYVNHSGVEIVCPPRRATVPGPRRQTGPTSGRHHMGYSSRTFWRQL